MTGNQGSTLTGLRQRLESRVAVVGVVGLGYVGLPQAVAVAEAGFACVSTPLDEHGEPDLSAVDGTARSVAAALRPGQLVVLVSTTYPGTTEERVLPVLEATGLRVGRDFALGYAPEREDPGNARYGMGNTPKLVSGCTAVCRELTERLYQQVVEKVVAVSGPRVAEAAKLLENVYRAVNIALVNELKLCFEHMGIDVWEVLEAAATKPVGFTPFYPGPGLGGHCIPIDPFYLTWKAREDGFHTRFITGWAQINGRNALSWEAKFELDVWWTIGRSGSTSRSWR